MRLKDLGFLVSTFDKINSKCKGEEMSIDYMKILDEPKTTVEKFRGWMNFWELGEANETDEEIRNCIEMIDSELNRTEAVRHLVLATKDRVDDLIAYLDSCGDEVSRKKLYEYILKFECEWSKFKSKNIIDEDTYFGKLLFLLNKKTESLVTKEK